MDFKNNKLEINDKEIYIISTPTIKIMESCFKYVMEEHAKIISKDNIDIIEIGFGMGFFANYIQDNYNVNTHTIVEIHPQIIKIIKKWKEDKPNVILIEGDWFDKQDEIKKRKYDSIYYDSVLDSNRLKFKDILFDIKKSKTIFSYFDPFDRNTFGFKNLKYKKIKNENINCLKNDYLYIHYIEL